MQNLKKNCWLFHTNQQYVVKKTQTNFPFKVLFFTLYRFHMFVKVVLSVDVGG